MSIDSLPQMESYTFEPALQDISLKRFRLRYCSNDDCYYLHWDNPVCRPLAKLYGLEEGLHQSSGIQRYVEKGEEPLSYLSCQEGVSRASLEWVIDFSNCGLVIQQLALKARCSYDNQANVSLCVQGDNSITVSPQFTDQHVDLSHLVGCSKLSILMTIEQSPEESVRLLPTFVSDDPPLDIIVDLMCPRKSDEIYAGELLLGIKYTSNSDSEGHSDPESVSTPSLMSESVTGVEEAGHLQVHIVEGAGIVDEVTHKPFNAVCKCEFIPSTSKHNHHQTSPKHNAYPTWTQQFNFEGLSRQELINGGLEVILYDYHKFTHNTNIGGLRMCVPKKKMTLPQLQNNVVSATSSPVGSRGSSPAPLENGDYNSDGSLSPILLPANAPRSVAQTSRTSVSLPRDYISITNRRSLPNSVSLNAVSQHHLSPEVLRRAPSPDVNSLSQSVIRRTSSASCGGGAASKSKFRLSGSHLINFFSPGSSPRSSPISKRKMLSRYNSVESDYVHWWMEDTPGPEVRHWQQVLEKDGEWVYFWHLIRPHLKSAY